MSSKKLPLLKSQLYKVAFFSFILFWVLQTGCNNQEKKQVKPEEFRFQEVTISELQSGYREGTFTIKEVVKAYLDRINDIDQNGPALHSVICINPDALQIAEQLDKEMKEGKIRGPMHGIPVILKDNIDTHDKMPCTGGSRALAGSFPLKDAYIVQKLREAGAVIIAKANLSEWANFRGELSTSGWSGVGGQTKNPYDLSRNPCGSSSGSGVAVSANLTVIAIGTETNGSIVCPATVNGIVGIKPTVGLLSRSGIIPISFTQDTPGPMARTVRDAAICLGSMVGVDPGDSLTSLSEGKYFTDYTVFLKEGSLKGKRLGLYKETLGRHFKVDSLMAATVEFLKKQGAEVIEIEKLADPTAENLSFDVLLYEYKDGLNKYFKSLGPDAPVKNVDELIAFNLKDSVELDYFNQQYLLLANKKGNLDTPEYKAALAGMKKMMAEEGIDKIMNTLKLDAIIAPTGAPAWKTDLINGDSFMVGSSSPAAIAGYPGITLPMGNIDGLPVGITFFGKAWSEPLLIEIAYSFEQASNHRIIPQFRQ